MILALFFTRGMSLETWVETGLFDREKLIYEEHLKRGHFERIYWLTYGSNDAEIAKQLRMEKRLHSSIEIIPMPGIFKANIGMLIYSFLMSILQRNCLKQADIYKTNQMDGSWSAVFAKFCYGKPLIVRTGYTLSAFAKRLQNSKTRIFIYQLMERLAFKYADCVTVTSKKDKKYISDIYKCPSSKLVILPNFIDTVLFKPLNIKKYADRIVFVGRLNSQKNLFNLISAIAKTDFTLDIYGKGELWKVLEMHAKKQGAIVNFMGTVPNKKLPEILNRYKYYILTSYFEGMPKTLLESMACGLVCIGTDVEGINEVIENGVNGVLAKGTDVDSLTKAIQSIESNSHQQTRLGFAAVQTIINEFSLERVLAQEWMLCQLFL